MEIERWRLALRDVEFESLIEHRDFTRSVALGILRDPGLADDVTQEVLATTWQAAGVGRSFEKGWFATVARHLALQWKRKRSRRAEVEERGAHAESIREIDTTERLELGIRVAKAVSSLTEPYRQIVLLRYYEGLTSERIAERMGSSSGSVRSQLARAHEILRRKLEAEFDSRRACVLTLVRFADPTAVTTASVFGASSSVPLLLGAGMTGCLAIWIGSQWLSGKPWLSGEEESRTYSSPADVAESTSPRKYRERPTPSTDSAPMQRTAFGPALETAAAATPSLQDLMDRAARLQGALRTRLLQPSPEHAAEAARLGTDGGVSRILGRDRVGVRQPSALGPRALGSSISFATGGRDLASDWDLLFRGFSDVPVFEVPEGPPSIGVILDLGESRLETLVADADLPPTSLAAEYASVHRAICSIRDPAELRSAIEANWPKSDPERIEAAISDEREKQRERAGRSDPASPEEAFAWYVEQETLRSRLAPVPTRRLAALGRTYLLRSAILGKHDLLVAFRTLAADEFGYTIAWRILKQFVPSSDGSDAAPRIATTVDKEFESATPAELLDQLQQIREQGSFALLRVAPQRAEELRARFDDPDLNVSRIAPDDRFGPITTVNGGGQYLSFVNGSNDPMLAPTIRIDAGRFVCQESQTALGVVFDLGDLPWSTANEAARVHPQARVLLGIELGLDRTKPRDPGDPSPTERFERAVEGLGKSTWFSGATVELGHMYLARMIDNTTSQSDVTVIFMPVDRDANGFLTVGWRRLGAR